MECHYEPFTEIKIRGRGANAGKLIVFAPWSPDRVLFFLIWSILASTLPKPYWVLLTLKAQKSPDLNLESLRWASLN